MPIRIELSKPQFAFARATDRFPCMVAGFGAGKTFGAIFRALALKRKFPDLNVGYYLPTYDLVKRVGYEGFAEILEAMEWRHRILKSDREIQLAGCKGRVIFRSMDNPSSIVGFKHADAIVDELDTLKTDDAKHAWRKIIARNRQVKPDGSRGSVAVATTPEGFRFTYETWKKDPKALSKGYRLITATTYSNAKFLPEDYIPSMLATYPENLLRAYLNGEFVNLTSGNVYPEFDRDKNRSTETVKSTATEKEPLHIGMDFNVGKMAAIVHVLRGGDPHAVDEIVNGLDTPSVIKTIDERYKGHPIIVYPDASGDSRKSQNASESDLALLRGAKFSVSVNAANPRVRDRVLAANIMIHKDGVRRYRVNEDKCPHLVEAFEKQAYDANGEPDKTTGHDHPIDGATYFIAYKWPVKRPATTINLGMAR